MRFADFYRILTLTHYSTRLFVRVGGQGAQSDVIGLYQLYVHMDTRAGRDKGRKGGGGEREKGRGNRWQLFVTVYEKKSARGFIKMNKGKIERRPETRSIW